MSNPAVAYNPPVDQPPPEASGNPYGGFWARFAAHFVDSIIVGICAMAIAIAGTVATVGMAAGAESMGLLTLLIVVLSQLYHAYFVSSERMATPGKRVCGLYVTDEEGRRLSFGKALWRNVAALFSYVTLYIGFIMAGVTERKQALHDKLAGTLVHRQPGKGAVAVIVAIVALFMFVPVIGILAAVAIPAYADYTQRAKVAGVILSMSDARVRVHEYVKQKGAWPTAWEQIEGGANPMSQVPEQSRQVVEDIRLERDGAIVATVKVSSKQGEIRMTPSQAGDTLDWQCTSSQEIAKFVPARCRQ